MVSYMCLGPVVFWSSGIPLGFNFASIRFSIGRLKFPFDLVLLELPFEIWN